MPDHKTSNMLKSKQLIFFQVAALGCLLFCFQAISQQQLEKEIRFQDSGDMTIREALDRVATENNFFFSYSNAALAANAPLPLTQYNGTIGGFLTEALGHRYEFREIPGYIVIRYAPNKLAVSTEIEKTERQTIVKGFVRDLDSQHNVEFASIYEHNQLVSTLSDRNGYFELKLKKTDGAIWITLSKESYRDTSLMMLPPVDIISKNRGNRLRFNPGDDNTEAIEQTFLGRMFIGFRQRFQRINLSGFFGESPYQMSLVPGLSSQGMFSSQMINQLSLNVIGGYSGGTEGFESAGVFNINQRHVKGFQAAGIVNMVGGEVRGFQAAGIHNFVYGEVKGFQVAGIYNRSKKETKGLQVAGIYNLSDSAAHHQIGGIANQTLVSKGIQIAGITNIASKQGGLLQLSGLHNLANGSVGYQIAGLVNKAQKVDVLQLGIVNIAEESDYPIGLLNFIQNGRKSLSLSMDESSASMLTLRTGGRKLYGLLGLGYLLASSDTPYAYELGFGYAIRDTSPLSLDLELANRSSTDFRSFSNHTSSLRLLPAYHVSPGVRVFLSPSLNFAVWDSGQDTSLPGWVLTDHTTSRGTYGIYGGVMAGIQLVLQKAKSKP